MISVYYIYLYVFVSILLLFKKRIFLILTGIALVFFSGLRYGVGIDYFSYETKILSEIDPLNYIEPLSRMLMLFSRSSDNVVYFFLFSSLIYIFFIFCGYIRLNIFRSLTIYIFTFFTISYLTSFGFVRQFSATGILFFGLTYLYQNKRLWFIVFCLLAFLFHKMAILYLPIIFCRKLFFKDFKPVYYVAILLMSFIFGYILIYLIQIVGFYSHYINRFEVFGQKIFFSLTLVFLFVLFVEYLFSTSSHYNNLKIYSRNLTFCGLFIYGCFLSQGEHVARVSYFLLSFFPVYISTVYFSIKNNNIKAIFLIFIIFCSTFYFFYTIHVAYSSKLGINFLNNYKFIWSV